jgi:CHAT domain-containing protein
MMDLDDIVTELVTLDDPSHNAQTIVSHLDSDQLLLVAEGLKRKVLFFLRSDAQKASDLTTLILRIAEWRQNAPLVRALGLQTQAIVLTLKERDYELALERFAESNAAYEEQKHELGIAIGQVARVWALACLQRFDEAFIAGDWAENVLTKHAAHQTLAALSNNLTAIYIRNGQDAEALDRIVKVEAAYSQLGEEGKRRRPLALINRAFVLRNLGRFQESLVANEQALTIAEELGQTANIARAKENLGITYFVLGQFNKAHVYLQEARDLFLADQRYRDAILVELFISDGYLQLRRFEAVLEKCRQVRQTFQEAGTKFEIAQAFLNEATALAGLNEFEQAHEVLDEARQIFIAENNMAWQIRTDLEEALLYYRQQRHQDCLVVANACLSRPEIVDQPVIRARAQIIVAQAALDLGELELAQTQTAQALQIAREKDLPALSYQCHYLSGQIALAGEDLEGALAQYEAAILELEKLQGQIMIEFRADFLVDKETVYANAVDLCLEMDDAQLALEYAERAKSRSLLFLLSHHLDLKIGAKTPQDQPLVDQLIHLREKRDRLYRRWETGETPGSNVNLQVQDKSLEGAREEARQDIVTTEDEIRKLWHRLLVRNAAYSRDASLWQVYSKLEHVRPSPDTLIIEYFVLEESLVAFLISSGGVRACRLAVSMETINRQRQRLWHNFSTLVHMPQLGVELTRKAQRILYEFYHLLIEPFADQMKPFRRLIIVPHGTLHYVPFHAFFDGEEYLLANHQISYLPGSSFIGANQTNGTGSSRALVMGNDREGALLHVAAETEVIAQRLETTPYLNQAATLERFREQAPQANIVHIAAHGDFRPDNPLFSGLHLNDGLLTTLDIFNLTLPASLVTLSACQTGRGVVGGGDELLGLMRAFLAAGTASLLLTLWRVDDEATAAMMRDFYAALMAGQPKIVALQQTQQHIIASNKERPTGHPYYWAPFFLVGDAGRV